MYSVQANGWLDSLARVFFALCDMQSAQQALNAVACLLASTL
jgi:hypothetical protein